MKIIGMIPARLGSKRVPKKNLRLLNGRPLISYNIETAVKSGVLDEVYVNSEAEIIIVLDKFYGELEPVIKKTKIKNVIVCSLTDLLSPLMKFVVKSVLFFKGESNVGMTIN